MKYAKFTKYSKIQQQFTEFIKVIWIIIDYKIKHRAAEMPFVARSIKSSH